MSISTNFPADDADSMPVPETPGPKADIPLSPPASDALTAAVDDAPARAPERPRRPLVSLRFLVRFALLLVVVLTGLALWVESQTSLLQAELLTGYAKTLTYEVEPGASDSIRYPKKGPFDTRLGYVGLPDFLKRLQANGMQIDAQARISYPMLQYADMGLFIPYHEKTNAGIEIRDMQDEVIYRFRYPQWAFAKFEDIPPIMRQSLLFIEDRDVLTMEHPYRNPAIDWVRFFKAAAFKVGEELGLQTPSMGGSTLATQIEKYRHSDDGITSSVSEKLRQIASASVRVYQQGDETLPARQRLVLDYLNTVPLSAAPGYGEVNGIGDGLYVWFGADPAEVNRLLRKQDISVEELPAQGMALRQVVALMIAHRRPSDYLARSRAELEELTESYVRLLAREGFITNELRDAALARKLEFRNFSTHPATAPIPTNKGVNVARTRLGGLLGTSLYDLDRMDLTTHTTLQGDLQRQVTDHLRSLMDPTIAKQNGLVGEYLLKEGQASGLRYSFTLFEKTPTGNRVRVQTDNTDKPFDINEGSKLELGSTAKLRVLATYLEVISEIWHRHQAQGLEEQRKALDAATDVLSRWTLDVMVNSPGIGLADLLNNSLQRTYSASPGERFFTGGGMHTFGNFKREDNGRNPTVLESLQESINLPFVRMLRDIVKYTNAQSPISHQEIMADETNPRRQELLNRFIDRESSVFLSRFWAKYKGKPADERLDTFVSGLRLTAGKLAVIHRYIYPSADQETFTAFLKQQLPSHPWSAKEISRLYEQYGRDKYNLQDQGYLARVHPLELWLLGYLLEREAKPGETPMTLKQALVDSATARTEVYKWLMKTRAKNARDSRIRTTLEVEAFSDIHRRWKQLGYPFDHLVPSLATALGSSGDRPAALAELMGIIQNRGLRLPVYRIDDMVFAAGTPYETRLSQKPQEPLQVMDPLVADTLRYALSTVVQEGTGRRIKEVFKLPDGTALVVGGKTGTGDNRLVTMGAGGQRIKARALSRTATFVFYLGDHHFGTLTAFVPGGEASKYSFTSALPVQVLKSMAPLIQPQLIKDVPVPTEEVPTADLAEVVP